MTNTSTGKVALVTGASRGIGRGIALRLAQDGYNIAVNYSSSKELAHEVVESAQGLGVEAYAHQCDISDVRAIQSMVRDVARRFGRLDVLVNNAGGAIRKPFADISPEDYDYQFGLARGTFFAMQEAAVYLQDCGRIISITSAAVRTSPADAAVYAGAKSAMEAFSKSLARSLGSRNITVNVVAPGATMTDLLKNAPPHIMQSVSRNAFQRPADIAEIADVVGMLCRADARWLTGQVIQADGGL